jgi:hypothetical protein
VNIRWLSLAAIGLSLATGAAAEQAAVPTPRAVALEKFLRAGTPICEKQPSARCVDVGWRFADADRDGSLSRDELEAVHRAAQDWYAWKGRGLSAQERASVGLGLAMVDGMGVDRMMQGYDANGDGRISKEEALVDVRLDERPLGEVLRDPNSFDRQATARRLGLMGPVFGQLFR